MASPSLCSILTSWEKKGKAGNYGMSAKELAARHVSKESSDVLDKRKEAYDTYKTELAKEMVKRATKKGVKFSYVLGDSWFTCQSIVKFFADKRRKAHWLGMIKVGETGRTKYQTGGKSLTAHELIRLGKKQGRQEYSRKLKCFYIVVA